MSVRLGILSNAGVVDSRRDGRTVLYFRTALGNHLLAASGGPEFAFTVLSVAENRMHPTLNLTNSDPKCDLDYVPNVARERVIRAALSNSFGFGGQNATIVVRKYGADSTAGQPKGGSISS